MSDLRGRNADETVPDIATWGTGNVLETGEGTVKVDLDGKASLSQLDDKASLSAVFVAASDAPEEQKRGADFVCDGVDDHVEIQQAIDKAGVGGTCIFTKGLFLVDYDEIFGLDQQKIIMQTATIIRARPGQEVVNSAPGLGLIAFKGGSEKFTGVTIEGGTLDGNKDNITLTGTLDFPYVECLEIDDCIDVTVINVKVINSPGEGIDMDNCENVLVKKIIARDCDGLAVHFSSGTIRSTVIESRAYDCGHKFERAGFDTGGSTSDDNTIENCHTYRCYMGAVVRASRGVVNNCRFVDSESHQISGDGTSCRITNNYIRGTKDVQGVDSINISGESSRFNCIIDSNTMLSGGSRGIVLENNSRGSVSNNIIGNTIFHGIGIDNGCSSIRVGSNTMRSDIRLQDETENCLVQNNIIEGGEVSDQGVGNLVLDNLELVDD